LNLLTGQRPYLSARVSRAGRVLSVPPEQFRRLLDTKPDLSDTIFRAFVARREILRLLEMRAPGIGVGGFSPVDPAGQPRGADLGFLRGASGIGLVLLGAATGVDPLWDRLLLLSPLRLEPLS